MEILTLLLVLVSLPLGLASPWQRLGKHSQGKGQGGLDKRDGVCSSGIYGELSPILQQYPIAVSFCQSAYPVKCALKRRGPAPASSSTTSLSTTKSTTKSTAKPTGTSTATKASTTLTTSKTSSSTKASTTTLDAKASALSKLKTQAQSVVSTLCSCIQPSKSCTTSTTTTTTKSTTTATTTSTTTTTPSSTTTSTTTTTETTTTTTTTTSTTTTTTTTTDTTTTSTLPTGNGACQATAFPTAIGAVGGYTQQFAGSGVQTNPATDSGNTQPAEFPPYTNNLPVTEPTSDTSSDCFAISQCASLTVNRPANYYSFDLHFDTSINQYVCVQYYDPGQTASDFTVVNPAVGAAYGYTAYS